MIAEAAKWFMVATFALLIDALYIVLTVMYWRNG